MIFGDIMSKFKVFIISLWILTLIFVFNGFGYKGIEFDDIVQNYPETELASLNDARMNFKEGHGIIQIKVTNLSSSGKKRGGVYVSVNGTIKLNITTQDPRNLRVKANDIIIVKGHDLAGNATVTISDVAGFIEHDVKGQTIEVGNLAKYFVTIKPQPMD
jgi:hypothetical protein